MITLTVVTKVIPGKQEEFLQAVRFLTSCLHKKGKSINPTLYQEVNDQSVFNLICELGTKEELKKLLSAEEFKVLLGAFRVLCEKSKIRCRFICQNIPRHACNETLSLKFPKNMDLEAQGPQSFQKEDESQKLQIDPPLSLKLRRV